MRFLPGILMYSHLATDTVNESLRHWSRFWELICCTNLAFQEPNPKPKFQLLRPPTLTTSAREDIKHRECKRAAWCQQPNLIYPSTLRGGTLPADLREVYQKQLQTSYAFSQPTSFANNNTSKSPLYKFFVACIIGF